MTKDKEIEKIEKHQLKGSDWENLRSETYVLLAHGY